MLVTTPLNDGAHLYLYGLDVIGLARYDSMVGYPRARHAVDRVTEHRTVNDFAAAGTLPAIITSGGTLVDAFPLQRKGSFWWVWGDQLQRATPEHAGLPDRTEEQWWPLSHFHWRCHVVAKNSSHNYDVEMGEWEAIETIGTVLEVVSSTSVIVELPDGHSLVSGTYSTSGTYVARRNAVCVVDGNELTVSGGSGTSFGSWSEGRPITIHHYDTSEADGNHCLKPGMLLRAWLALPWAEQPQYLSSPTATVTVEAVNGSLVTISNAQLPTTWNTGTRPSRDATTSVTYYGDLVYLRLLDPARQKCTVLVRDEDLLGGTLSFPGGHHFAPGGTVKFNEHTGFDSFQTYLVDSTTETTVTLKHGPGAVGAAFPAVDSTRHLEPGPPWIGYHLDYGSSLYAGGYSDLSLRVTPPTAEGTYGELATTQRSPVQAVEGEAITLEVDMGRAGGFYLECMLSQETLDVGQFEVGESLQLWLDDTCYVEITRTTAELRGGDGLLLSPPNEYDPYPGRIGILAQPAYHRAGWVVAPVVKPRAGFPIVMLDRGAYVPTCNGKLTLKRGEGGPLKLAYLRNVKLFAAQDTIAYVSKDGNTGTFEVITGHMPLRAGVRLRLQFVLDDLSTVDRSGVITGLIYRRVQGTLATRTSETEGTIALAINEQEDGTYTANLRWGDSLVGYGRDGVTATIADDTLTFSGGEGDELPELYHATASTLTVRSSDTAGRVGAGSNAGVLSNGHPGRLTWTIDDTTYERTGVSLSVYSTYTAVSGGSGDPLPPLDTPIVLHQIHVRVHAITPHTSWTPVWGGTFSIEFETEPPAPGEVVRVYDREMYRPFSFQTTLQHRPPALSDSVWPWGMRMTAVGTLDDGEFACEYHGTTSVTTGGNVYSGQEYRYRSEGYPDTYPRLVINLSLGWLSASDPLPPLLRPLLVRVEWRHTHIFTGTYYRGSGGDFGYFTVPEHLVPDGATVYFSWRWWKDEGEWSGWVTGIAEIIGPTWTPTYLSTSLATGEYSVEIMWTHIFIFTDIFDTYQRVATSDNADIHNRVLTDEGHEGVSFTVECVDLGHPPQ